MRPQFVNKFAVMTNSSEVSIEFSQIYGTIDTESVPMNTIEREERLTSVVMTRENAVLLRDLIDDILDRNKSTNNNAPKA